MTQLAADRPQRWVRPQSTNVVVPSPVQDQAQAVFDPGGLMLLAVGIGLATGLIELVVSFVRWRFVDATALSALQLNQHAPWMVPLSHACVFGAGGIVLALVHRLGRACGIVPVSVFGLCFLSCFSLLLSYRGLSTIAVSTLSGGIALRAAQAILRHARVTRRIVTCIIPAALFLVASFWAIGRARERIEECRLTPPPPHAPNVLLVVLDTVRAESLRLYGYARATSPVLERLAHRGVRFDQARAAGSWTLPSHASLFTGRWPHELSARLDRPLDKTYPTLAEFLGGHGYDTAGFVANTFFCSRWFGLARGFLHYEDVAVDPLEILRSSGLGRLLAKKLVRSPRDRPTAYFERKDAPTINGELLDWLAARPRGRPFFAFLNFYDAHDPYTLPEGWERHFGRVPGDAREWEILHDWHRINKAKLDRTTIELAQDCYDDCIAYLDSQLGQLFEALQSRGLLDDTLVIVTADHGEEFGEHGGFGHGQSLHCQVIRVPLLVIAPGRVPSGRIVRTPVSLRDLPATVVDLLGLSGRSPFPGRSLARHWQSTTPRKADPEEPVLSEIVDDEGQALDGSRPSRSLVDEGMLYLVQSDGRETLYDLEADPAEKHDLSTRDDLRPVLERFRAALRRIEVESVPETEPSGSEVIPSS